MRIDSKQFKNLPVETKSGLKLGNVKDFVLETDGQSILQYEVGGLFGKKYLISREQVLSIGNEKIIVDDEVITAEKDLSLSEGKNEKIDMEPVAMREE